MNSTRSILLLIPFIAATHSLAPADVVLTAQKEGYTAFHDAVMHAGLYEHAKKKRDEDGSLAPFTVFVPTNEAFKAIQSLDEKTKKKLITLHVVPHAEVKKPDEEMKTGLPTVGEKLLFAQEGKVFIDESETKATVIKGPIPAENGLVYVIDAVLLPAGVTAPKPAEETKPTEPVVPVEAPKAAPAVKAAEEAKPVETKKQEEPVKSVEIKLSAPEQKESASEKTVETLTTAVTQLTQSIQLLIHVIQQAQTQGVALEREQEKPIVVN